MIQERLKRYGLAMKPGVDFEVIDPRSDPRYRDYDRRIISRSRDARAITPDAARTVVRTSPSVIPARWRCIAATSMR